jgi:endoglucanase
MQVLAGQSTATWFGNWNTNIENDVHTLVTAAQAQNATPVMVAYNIPERDCGGFSAGGSDNPAGYTAWINSFAQGLGNSPAIIILEPDSLAQISCLSSADQQTRLQLLASAVTTLKADANAKVYLDAGHSGWIDPTTMAGNLTKANVAAADGFSLNVSNFMPTANEISYGQQISSQINGKHFVVDTSRNGNGSDGQWCNPPGMAIGTKPTFQTGNSLVDAFLWLKTPGESDGTCNGGPSAGVWCPTYALQLVQNAQ